MYLLCVYSTQLWYAKTTAINQQLPLAVYLAQIEQYMIILINALVFSALYIFCLTLWIRQNSRFYTRIILILSATSLHLIMLKIQFPLAFNITSTWLMVIGILLNLLVILDLVRQHSQITTWRIRQLPNDKQYHVLAYYLYVIAILSFINTGVYFIIYLYHNHVIPIHFLDLPIPLSAMTIKIIFAYHVAMFISCFFCATQLWEQGNKIRLLAAIILLFISAFYGWLGFYAIYQGNILMILLALLYLTVSIYFLTMVIRTKKH